MRQNIFKRIPSLSRLQGGEGSLQSALVKATSGSFALRVSNIALVFLLNVLLARSLGASGLGAYTFATAWVNILGLMTTLGFSRLLVREMSVYRDRSEWGLMRGLLRRANQIVLPFSTIAALVAVLVALSLRDRASPEVIYTFCLAMPLVPLTALVYLRRTAMQGLRRIVSGQMPDLVLRPILSIAFVAAAYLLLRDSLSAPWAMAASLCALLAAFLVGAVLLRRAVPAAAKSAAPEYRTRIWLQGTLPLMFLSVAQIINTRTDVIMLGAISGAESAGIYTVAARGAEIVTFLLMASNAALGPTISSLYAAGDMERLQRLVTRASRLVLLGSLPIALSLIVFGRWFLLIFGSEFMQGSVALAILCVGALLSAAMCAVSLLLVMSGRERRAAAGVGIGAALNVTLNAILIPRIGIEGAAVATATSLMLWNLLLAFWVYKKLGLYPTAIGRAGIRRGGSA